MAAFFDTLADIIVHPRENFAAAKQKSRQLSKQISEINVKDTKKYAVAGLKKLYHGGTKEHTAFILAAVALPSPGTGPAATIIVAFIRGARAISDWRKRNAFLPVGATRNLLVPAEFVNPTPPLARAELVKDMPLLRPAEFVNSTPLLARAESRNPMPPVAKAETPIESGEGSNHGRDEGANPVKTESSLQGEIRSPGLSAAAEKINGKLGTATVLLNVADKMAQRDIVGAGEVAGSAVAISVVMKLAGRFVPIAGQIVGAGYATQDAVQAAKDHNYFREIYSTVEAGLYTASASAYGTVGAEGSATLVAAEVTGAVCWNPPAAAAGVSATAIGLAVTAGTFGVAATANVAAVTMTTARTLWDSRGVVSRLASGATDHVMGWLGYGSENSAAVSANSYGSIDAVAPLGQQLPQQQDAAAKLLQYAKLSGQQRNTVSTGSLKIEAAKDVSVFGNIDKTVFSDQKLAMDVSVATGEKPPVTGEKIVQTKRIPPSNAPVAGSHMLTA